MAESQTEPEPGVKVEAEVPPPEPIVTSSPAPIVAGRDAAQPARVAVAQPLPAVGSGMNRFESGVVITVLLGIAVAALVALALPRKALLMVSAIGPADGKLRNLKITVDGELKCEKSPCWVGELGAGEHTIRVASDEFGVAERVVAMRSGADHSLAFVLDRPRQDLGLAKPIASAGGPADPSADAPLPEAQGAGQTPANISAAPGLHTVVFIHPDYGRREVVVQVKPNQDAVAAVRFRRSGL